MLKIDAEVCHNCKNHSWFTQHNPQRYEDNFQLLKITLEDEFENAIVQKNYVPSHFTRVYSKYYTDDVYYDSHTDELRTMPRVGAFEVQVLGKTVYSKLKTGTWPHIPSVVLLVRQLVDGYNRGEDLDEIIERTTQNLKKITSNAGSLKQENSSGYKTKIKMPNRANSVSRSSTRSEKLQPIIANFSNSNNNSRGNSLNRTVVRNNNFRVRSQTPELKQTSERRQPSEHKQTPERKSSNTDMTQSQLQKPKQATLYIRDKIYREYNSRVSAKALDSQIGDSSISLPTEMSRKFRAGRYTSIINTTHTENCDNDMPMYLQDTSFKTEYCETKADELVLQEVGSIRNIRIGSPSKEIVGKSEKQRKMQLDIDLSSGHESRLKQSNSTEDTDGIFRNDPVNLKFEQFTANERMSLDAEALVNKYQEYNQGNNHCVDLLNNIQVFSNQKVEEKEEQEPENKLRVSEVLPTAENNRYESLSDSQGFLQATTFRACESEQPNTKPIEVSSDIVDIPGYQITPKYGERKEFFEPNELQKTAQFARQTIVAQDQPPLGNTGFLGFPSQHMSQQYNKEKEDRGFDPLNKRQLFIPKPSSQLQESRNYQDQLTFRYTSPKGTNPETELKHSQADKSVVDEGRPVSAQQLSNMEELARQRESLLSAPSTSTMGQKARFRKKRYHFQEKSEEQGEHGANKP